MSSEIRNKIVELCEVILKDQKYKESANVIDTFLEDDSKNAEYKELIKKHATLNERLHEGGTISDEESMAFEAESKKVFSNTEVAKFTKAQTQLDQLCELVNTYVDLSLDLGNVPNNEEVDEVIASKEHDEDCGCGCGHDH